MSLISVKNLTFGYEGSYKNVFENASFNIDTDWKLGLIGRNGKGKTTLLKLLQGKYDYRGTISKSVDIDYFPFDINNNIKHQNITAIEVVNQIAPNAEDWKIIKELNLLDGKTEILYNNFNNLSGGEQVKILLISLFLKENNFLLIDEPTNHLDSETKENLAKYLQRKKGFILVSHDREFLDKVVDHIISINNTNIEVLQGNFSTWKENKIKQDIFEQTQNDKLQKNIKRLEISSKNTASWSNDAEKAKSKKYNNETRIDRGYEGHKAAKIMKTSKVMEKRINKEIEQKSNMLQNIDRTDLLKIKRISEQANIYIWDEPLNYIDIITREQIEDSVLKYMPTLIFVEHDATFIKKIATKTIKINLT